MHPPARDDSGTDAGPRAWLSRPDALLISRAGEKAAEVSGTPHLDNQLQKGSEYQCFDIRLTAIYRKHRRCDPTREGSRRMRHAVAGLRRNKVAGRRRQRWGVIASGPAASRLISRRRAKRARGATKILAEWAFREERRVKRTALFLATNLAVVLVLSVTLRLLGVEPYLNEQGLNLNALLIFAAVFGFGGAFISLALSKWTAKRAVGAQVISQPSTPAEQWLVQTVARQARSPASRCPRLRSTIRPRSMLSPPA